MSRLIWIYAVCKSLLSTMAVKELNRPKSAGRLPTNLPAQVAKLLESPPCVREVVCSIPSQHTKEFKPDITVAGLSLSGLV